MSGRWGFGGVCVGGPLDGQKASCNGDTLYAAVIPKFVCAATSKEAPCVTEITRQTVRYVHREILCEGYRHGLWVVEDMANLPAYQILNHLISNYRPEKPE